MAKIFQKNKEMEKEVTYQVSKEELITRRIHIPCYLKLSFSFYDIFIRINLDESYIEVTTWADTLPSIHHGSEFRKIHRLEDFEISTEEEFISAFRQVNRIYDLIKKK